MIRRRAHVSILGARGTIPWKIVCEMFTVFFVIFIGLYYLITQPLVPPVGKQCLWPIEPKKGDYWTFQKADDTDLVTYRVIDGPFQIAGKVRYVLEKEGDYPYPLKSPKWRIDWNTGELLNRSWSSYLVRVYFFSESYSYEYPRGPPTNEVGKEYTQIVKWELSMDETSKNSGTYTNVFKIEKKEEITVPAGTFMCTKIVSYFENGDFKRAYWYSDEANNVVKEIGRDGSVKKELVDWGHGGKSSRK